MNTMDDLGAPLESLYRRFRRHQDLEALAALFDRAAPRLLSFARRLANRQAEAEDWVQETFLTVLEQPDSFPDDGQVMPWLLGVLVNRARASRRSAQRELDPDRLATREVTRPEDKLSAAEVQAAIEAAIGDLPAGQRLAVRNRLFDGRSSSELGRDLGLDAGAVRARLHRGLERLRAALPAGLATGLFAWISPTRGLAAVRADVLNQAAGTAAAPLLSGTTSAAVGTTVMANKWTAWIAGAGLAALLGLGFSRGLEAPRDPDSEALQPDMEGLALVRKEIERANPGPLRTVASVESAPLESAAVIVSVTGTDGSPAPAEAIVLEVGQGADRRQVQGKSDQAGQAHLALEPGVSLYSLELPLTPERPLVRTIFKRRLRRGETYRFTLQLDGGFSLRGRVEDEEGRPVPGAEVLAWCPSQSSGEAQRRVQADSHGLFELQHLGPDVRITAKADGMACLLGLRGKPDPGRIAEDLALVMTPALELRGQVVHPDGTPAGGVQMLVEESGSLGPQKGSTQVPGIWRFQPNASAVTTDSSGQFRLGGLAKGRVALKYSFDGYLRLKRGVDVGDHGLCIVLEEGDQASGQVFTSSGGPAAGAEIRWGPYKTSEHYTPRQIQADDLGRYTLEGLRFGPTDRPWIGVAHPGHAIELIQPFKPDSQIPDIHLKPEQILGGLVVDGNEEPLPGIRIQCRGTRHYQVGYGPSSPPTWERALRRNEAITDESGRFELRQLYPGPFVLLAYSPSDPQKYVAARANTGAGDLRIEISAKTLERVVVSGRVTDGLTHEPVPEFSVSMHPVGSSFVSDDPFLDTEGHYRITGIEPGDIRFGVFAPGYARLSLPARHFDLGQHTLSMEVFPSRTLEVSASRPDGSSVPGATGRFLDGDLSWSLGGGWGAGDFTVTAEPTRLHGLPARPVTLLVSGDGDSQSLTVDLSADRVHKVECILNREPLYPTRVVLFEATAQAGDPAWRQTLANAIRNEDKAWFEAHTLSGALALPKDWLTLSLDFHAGWRVGHLSGKSTPSNGELELLTIASAWNQGSSSTTLAPLCMFQADLPDGEYALSVYSEAYERIDRKYRVEPKQAADPLVLFLQRK